MIPPNLRPDEHAAVALLGSAIEHEHMLPARLWPHLRLGAARALRELATQTRIDSARLREDDGATLCLYAADLDAAARAIEREHARVMWVRTKPLRVRMRRVRETYGPRYECAFERSVCGLMRDALRMFVRGET